MRNIWYTHISLYYRRDIVDLQNIITSNATISGIINYSALFKPADRAGSYVKKPKNLLQRGYFL